MTQQQREILEEIRIRGPETDMQNHMRACEQYLTPAQLQAVRACIRYLAQKIPPQLTQLQKLQLIYELVTCNMQYADDYSKNETRYSYISALLQETSVCMGFSELFCLFGKELGIPIRYVVGVGWSDGLHAWNLIQLTQPDGPHWWHMDACWELGNRDGPFEFFLLTDREIQQKNHAFLPGMYPTCDTPAPQVQRLPPHKIEAIHRLYRKKIYSIVHTVQEGEPV